MTHIPAPSLTHLPTRLAYTTSFLAFTPADGALIQASAPLIAPLIPALLDVVYTKLLSYDITAAAFVPPQAPTTSTGAGTSTSTISPPTSPADLHLTHPHIAHRKAFLRAYLLKIARNDDWTPTSPLWAYMDAVAIAHTGAAGATAALKRRRGPGGLRVEYMQLGLLLGYVADAVAGAVLGMEEEQQAGGPDLATKVGVVRAWGKVLWLQNDLFARR
ncbi:MAG: hypothetical protein Q9167_008005, partial [Letrouitia subvulpina]